MKTLSTGYRTIKKKLYAKTVFKKMLKIIQNHNKLFS